MLLEDILDDELLQMIEKAAENPIFAKAFPEMEHIDIENDDERLVLEDSDLYGFSCMNINVDDNEQPKDLFEEFQKDENWNNPASIPLMLKSFGIDDELIYWKTLYNSKEEDSYLHKKAMYYHEKAVKLIDEAAELLKINQIGNAIKKLSEAIRYEDDNADAYFIRANAFIRLQDWESVEKDIVKALELNPYCPATKQLYDNVQSILTSTRASMSTLTITTPVQSSITSATFVQEQGLVTVQDTTELRAKLLKSLQQSSKDGEQHGGGREVNCKDSGSSSDSDVSDSSSENSHKKSKHSKHKKKHKNHHKHSKHKKKKHKHNH